MSFRGLSAALCLVLFAPITSARAERLTDEQVKALIEDIDKGYDIWKDDLEKRNLDDAKITTPERTIDVKTVLKDFEKAIDAVKDRFKPDYAASPEVLALLRLGSDVERYSRRPGETPSSAWTALSAKLESLAEAYDLDWPVESIRAQAARLNDGEVASRIERIERSAKQLEGEADKAAKADKSLDKATREGLKTSIQDLERTAKDVRERVKDDRPAANEVGQLLSRTRDLEGMITRLRLSPGGTSAWDGIESGSDMLARAYGLRRP
jgi:hypothetical protein